MIKIDKIYLSCLMARATELIEDDKTFNNDTSSMFNKKRAELKAVLKEIRRNSIKIEKAL